MKEGVQRFEKQRGAAAPAKPRESRPGASHLQERESERVGRSQGERVARSDMVVVLEEGELDVSLRRALEGQQLITRALPVVIAWLG